MPKLTVVVTCSDRKTVAVDPTLRARDLPHGRVDRLDTWDQRLRSAVATSTLDDLYCGENWVQVKRLMGAAKAARFDAHLWIVSAGLGLQPAQSRAPGYAATFSTRHLDSVATDSCTARQWWAGLQERRGAPSLADLASSGPMLLVLGADYTKALSDDLAELERMSTEAVLFGGATGVASPRRVPSDARLRSELKGTLSSLNTRMATAWLSRLGSNSLSSTLARQDWNLWVERVSRTERYSRPRLTDDEVQRFISASLEINPSVARTTMLRRLREANRACEQARFARLYEKVKGTA